MQAVDAEPAIIVEYNFKTLMAVEGDSQGLSESA